MSIDENVLQSLSVVGITFAGDIVIQHFSRNGVAAMTQIMGHSSAEHFAIEIIEAVKRARARVEILGRATAAGVASEARL